MMTLAEAKTHWGAVVAMGEAVIALAQSRDLTQLAHGGAQASASIDLLYQAASGLLREMGQTLTALRDSPDPDVREYVALLYDRLCSPTPGLAEVSRDGGGDG